MSFRNIHLGQHGVPVSMTAEEMFSAYWLSKEGGKLAWKPKSNLAKKKNKQTNTTTTTKYLKINKPISRDGAGGRSCFCTLCSLLN